MKASSYLRGKLTKILGLRYAPELRFFKDNSLEILSSFQEQARQYLQESKTLLSKVPTLEDPKGLPKELFDFREKLSLVKKMDPFQRQLLVQNAFTAEERTELEEMLKQGQIEKLEKMVEGMIQAKTDEVGKVKQEGE